MSTAREAAGAAREATGAGREAAYDVVVVGGGSGGFGAALSAGRHGLRVLLLEPGPALGGNSTLGGVNTWEPGVGTPFAAELYDRLATRPGAVAVSRTVKHYTREQPWGHSRPDPGLPYESSLRRAGVPRDEWTRVTFEPDAMAAEMATLLAEAGNVTVRHGTRFVGVEGVSRRVTRVAFEGAEGPEAVRAGCVVDATAQVHVAASLGCALYLGAEPRSLYNEPSAPERHEDRLNGVSLCFRATPAETPSAEPLPDGVPDEPFLRVCAITEYPNGDLNINPLPIMEGMEWHRLGPAGGRRECERRVYRLWRTLQREYGFDRYRLLHLFPFTGVREGPRLIGRYVLTENDARAGYPDQPRASECVAFADHALDVHGEGHLCRELERPYGVPLDCLLPREWDNLIVACRGASFSHLAASSCRLSRTMIAIGHAAGDHAARLLE
jgi:hypothetical protein